MKRFALGVLILFAAAVIVIAVAFQVWRNSGKPERGGEFRVLGMSNPVSVRFDKWGVPHVDAKSLRDLAEALGWLHANDRMFQLELGRRHASGRLAEVLGAELLPEDRRMRTLRLRRTAARYLEVLTPESRDLLEAYASGVNSWLGSHRGSMPPDLRLLHIEPEPWKPIDSLCFTLNMSLDLCYPAGPEEQRFDWLRAFGPEKTLDLIGKKGAIVADEVLAAARKSDAPTTTKREDKPAGGSNNWAIGTSRTATGAPIVANDPHLALGLPALWFEAKLTSPEYEAYGMTLPGSPLIVIGQGPNVAWGFTNTELDTNDEFIEELSTDGNSVRRGTNWVPLVRDRETIKVKDAPDDVLELATTDIGPLLAADPARGLPARSLAWTAYTPFDPLTAFLALARAKTVDEIPKAIEGFISPVQNLVCADKTGGMLFTIFGRVPDRPKGDGSLPAPAWDASWAWRGVRSASSNPRITNPEDHVLATANNDVRPKEYALDLPSDFAGPWRERRIRDLLTQREGWWPAQTAEMQNDHVSLYALDLVKSLPTTLTGDAKYAADELARWDGDMRKVGASALFMLFERELGDRVFKDEFEAHHLSPLGTLRRAECLTRLMHGEMDASWFDDVSTSQVETRDDQVAVALAAAWKIGKARFGVDIATWNWGALNLWTPSHPLSRAPFIGRFFKRGPFEMPGSAHCIGVFTGSWNGDHVEVGHGASMRFVADTADPDRSLAVLPGGQSAHPFDVHFDDQIPIYLAGRARPIEWSESAIAEQTVSALHLHP